MARVNMSTRPPPPPKTLNKSSCCSRGAKVKSPWTCRALVHSLRSSIQRPVPRTSSGRWKVVCSSYFYSGVDTAFEDFERPKVKYCTAIRRQARHFRTHSHIYTHKLQIQRQKYDSPLQQAQVTSRSGRRGTCGQLPSRPQTRRDAGRLSAPTARNMHRNIYINNATTTTTT